MSDEMKNCCPPETSAPKMEVHDATEGSKDIKPKMISTAHKRLSQDEFQRKVAMVARSKAAMAPVVATGIRALLPNLAARASGVGASIASKLPAWMTGNAAKTVGALGAAGGAGAGIGALGGMFSHNMFSHKPTTMESITNALKGGYNTLAQNVGGNVGAGGIIGAGLGGLAGAMMPGEEEYEDENGNVRKRRRGMLSGALRGAGMGGLAGGAVGAGMDYFGKQSAAHDFGAALAVMQKEGSPLATGLRQVALKSLSPSLHQDIGKAMGRVGGYVGQQVNRAARNVAQNPVSTAVNAANAVVNPVGAVVGAGANLAGRMFR